MIWHLFAMGESRAGLCSPTESKKAKETSEESAGSGEALLIQVKTILTGSFRGEKKKKVHHI